MGCKVNFLLALVICLHCSPAASQWTIMGKVIGEKGAAVEEATISLCENGTTLILAYTFTDRNGSFTLSWNHPFDSLLLRVSCVGFTSLHRTITRGDRNIEFQLKVQVAVLREVKIKNTPVWKRKDTLNYNISAFKNNEDRVIGDVLRRLPGFEVTPSGQIKYNGVPINKYYIEGLDLLGKRYGLANNNLPVTSVENVQVFENHQPVKMLDGFVFSDRAAINIKLKTDNKFHVIKKATAGAGFTPLLTNDELLFMLFRKKVQAIDIYKYNNTGTDYANEIAQQNISDNLDDTQRDGIKTDLVALPVSLPLFISKEKYMNNNAHLVSANQLIERDSMYQLNINVDFLHDLQQLNSITDTRYYMPGDTVFINEKSLNIDKTNMLQSGFSLTANRSRHYFTDDLKYKAWWQEGYSNQLSGNNGLKQHLVNPFFTVSNNMRHLRVVKNHIHEIASLVGLSSVPQQLTITPGLYKEWWNNDTSYISLTQQATLHNFYTNNYYSIKYMRHKLSAQYKIGILGDSKRFRSSLIKYYAGHEKALSDSFQNNAHWAHVNVYIEPQWTMESTRLRAQLTIPFSWNILYWRDYYRYSHHDARMMMSPGITLQYFIDSHLEIKINAAYTQKSGDISDIVPGFILNTYRRLSINSGLLPESEMKYVSLLVQYKDPVKIWSINFDATLSSIRSNLVSGVEFYRTLELNKNYPNKNLQHNTSYAVRVSKYFISLKASCIFAATYTRSGISQLQEGDLVNLLNKNTTMNTSVSTKFSQKLYGEYSFTYSRFFSTAASQPVGISFSNYLQTGSLNITPFERFTSAVSFEYSHLDNTTVPGKGYFFLNINARYKLLGRAVELDLFANNLCNTQTADSANYFNNVAIISTYQLRPRQLLAKLIFSF